MRGGVFSISETFMKILSTAYVGVVFFGIFFAVNQYHIIFVENRMDRETLVAGNTVLSSCIAETRGGYPVKGLLSERIINAKMVKDRNIDCLNFNKGIYIEIYNLDSQLLYGIGNSNVCENSAAIISSPTPLQCNIKGSTSFTVFPSALNTTTNIIPVIVNVSIGVV
jgi:hypothetical protein